MIIRRNLYNMLFGYYVFLRRCESDYLHQTPQQTSFCCGVSFSSGHKNAPKSFPGGGIIGLRAQKATPSVPET